MPAPPVVVLTDAFVVRYNSNLIDAVEGTIYPAVLDVTDPDHPGAFVPDTAFEISGPDANQFYIVDTQLIFSFEADYEAPLDQGGDNTYEISVRVTDSDGDFTDQNIVITITDDPNDNNLGGEPPQFVSDPFAVVPENTGDVIYTAQVDTSGSGNADDVTFAIVDGADAGLFSIDPTTGEVFFNEPPDYENPADAGADNTYDIVIEAANQQSGLSSQLGVTIFVEDENDEAPELAPDAAVSVPENYSDVVYVAEATDADVDSIVAYAITGGADMDKFAINEHTGEVSFIQPPDFDQPGDADGDNTYEIEIVASDDAGNESQVQAVSVTVEDLSDETPQITSTEPAAEIIENAFEAIYVVEASDADAIDTVSFRFADDSPDAGYFLIDEFSGAIYPILPFDHESPLDADGDNVYELAIIASDGVNDSDAFTLSVTVLNENDNVPVMNADVDAISVPEDTEGTIYTAVAADDDGDALQYSLGGVDAHLFTLDPTTGELSFITPPDFETPADDGSDNIYDLEITASDGDTTSDALALSIEVTDVDEGGGPPLTSPPIVVLADLNHSPFTSNQIEVLEGTIYPLVFDVTDPDHPGAFVPDSAFEITGPDADQFYIVDTQLIFTDEPDYEAPLDQGGDNTYEISVRVTDSDGDFTDKDIVITITDDPNDNNLGGEPPQFVSDPFAVVPENTGEVAYTAQVDNSGSGNAEDVILAIVDGADASLFSIDPTTGDVFFNEPPDYENPADAGADNSYEIVIEAANQQSGLSSQLDVTIFVEDENDEAPQLAPDAAVSVPENYSDVLYVAEATDADADSTVAYAITGGADMDKFSINEHTGEVSFNQPPDFDLPGDADGDNTY